MEVLDHFKVPSVTVASVHVETRLLVWGGACQRRAVALSTRYVDRSFAEVTPEKSAQW